MKRRHLLLILAALVGSGILVYLLIPRPIDVQCMSVTRGPMRVTVDEEGRTRIKERYVVSAPLAGRLSRISLKAGASVQAGNTVLAAIDPGDPSLLDPRARAQAEARVSATDAGLRQAEASLARAGAAHEQSQLELERQREVERRGGGNRKDLEDAVSAEAIRSAEHKAAGFAVDIAKFELEQAKAALIHSMPGASGTSDDWRLQITSPVSGRVLRVLQESSAVVVPGAPLIEVGDPTDLEVRVDVLSSEAVAIRPGNPVEFGQWGGERPLNGVVRMVEPSAFTKVSALGVEEQRVYVIVDLIDPPEARASLGDGFRVEARIAVWENPAVLKAPGGALFRSAQTWAVYVADKGRARLRGVTVGRRTATEAQILSGLTEADSVVDFPGDMVREGVRINPSRNP